MHASPRHSGCMQHADPDTWTPASPSMDLQGPKDGDKTQLSRVIVNMC